MLRRLMPLTLCLLAISAGDRLAAQGGTGVGLTMTVAAVDGTGAPVPGARVIVTGPVGREAETREDGTIRMLRMKAGTYRVRVEHVRFITLERDVTLRAGQPQAVEMTLSEAPAPPALPEAAEEEPAPEVEEAPPGEPRSLLVTDFIESNFIGRAPIRDDELGCTASARTRLVQLREALPEESRADADEVLYVIAGEGTLRLGNRDVALRSSALAIVPRGTVRAISRKGRNPLIVLSVISGPACTGE